MARKSSVPGLGTTVPRNSVAPFLRSPAFGTSNSTGLTHDVRMVKALQCQGLLAKCTSCTGFIIRYRHNKALPRTSRDACDGRGSHRKADPALCSSKPPWLKTFPDINVVSKVALAFEASRWMQVCFIVRPHTRLLRRSALLTQSRLMRAPVSSLREIGSPGTS